MIINPLTMSCTVIYPNSKLVNFLIILVFIVTIFLASIYTFVRCWLHFRAYPESLTKKLLCKLISSNKMVSGCDTISSFTKNDQIFLDVLQYI